MQSKTRKNSSHKTINLSSAQILITGGAGFIGSNLAIELTKIGANVTVLDAMIKPYGANLFNLKKINKKVKIINGDVRSSEDVRIAVDGKDYIFHLAGQTGRVISMDNPGLDLDINCNGTLEILNAIRTSKRKPKIIFASSRGVIGQPKYLPVNESHTTKPRDVYGINKHAAEQYCMLFGNEYGFGATSLRLNNVYGPRCQIKSNHYGTINLFISYALQGKTLPVYGDGKQTRDYIYISDVVDAFVKATNKKVDGEVFFIGTGVPTSLLDIVKMIKMEIPDTKHKKVNFPKTLRSVDFPDFHSDSQKFIKATGWKSKVSIQSGIKKTSRFYSKYLSEYL